MHFEKASAVHQTLVKITRRLDELGIAYAISGAMAMFFHGVRRFTEDVDILVTREGLAEIHRRLEGLGYVSAFTGSKNLRDAETGVRIDFLVTGEFPGDGKPKPVAFPLPAEAGIQIGGIRFLQLTRLMDLKTASGMTHPGRLKDLGDVQQIIQTLGLTREFAEQLHPYVQSKYRELWDGVQSHGN